VCAVFQLWSFENYTSKFRPLSRHKISWLPSLLLPLLIFSYLQALIHDFLWWWASSWLIFSLKWHLLSTLFLLHSAAMIFKKQRTPLMKKIQGLQAAHGATSLRIRWGGDLMLSMHEALVGLWICATSLVELGVGMCSQSIPKLEISLIKLLFTLKYFLYNTCTVVLLQHYPCNLLIYVSSWSRILFLHVIYLFNMISL